MDIQEGIRNTFEKLDGQPAPEVPLFTCQVCGCPVGETNQAPAAFWCIGCFGAHWKINELEHERVLLDLQLQTKELELQACRTALNRLAHEAKDKLKDIE